MKKHLYLMPVLALSMASFALAGCDDKKDDQTVDQTTTESSMPAADVVAAGTDVPVAETAQASVVVTDARAFATAPGSTNGAVFLTLNNPQSTPDFLSAAKSDVASSVEIHQTSADPQTGAMQMRATSGVDVGAGQSVTLNPDGYHIMLLGLTSPLTEGQTFNVTLTFRNAGDVVVPVTVVAPGAVSSDTSVAPATDAAHESISGDEEAVTPDIVTPADADASGAATGTMDSTGSGSTTTAPEGSATIPNDPAAQ